MTEEEWLACDEPTDAMLECVAENATARDIALRYPRCGNPTRKLRPVRDRYWQHVFSRSIPSLEWQPALRRPSDTRREEGLARRSLRKREAQRRAALAAFNVDVQNLAGRARQHLEHTRESRRQLCRFWQRAFRTSQDNLEARVAEDYVRAAAALRGKNINRQPASKRVETQSSRCLIHSRHLRESLPARSPST